MSLLRCRTQTICPQKRKVIDMNGFPKVMVIGLLFTSFGGALAQAPTETTSTKHNREELRDNKVNENTEDDEIRKLQLERLKSASLAAETPKIKYESGLVSISSFLEFQKIRGLAALDLVDSKEEKIRWLEFMLENSKLVETYELASLRSSNQAVGENKSNQLANEDWYSITLSNFEGLKHQKAFEDVCGFLARSMSRLFAARPHWGKLCPLTPSELMELYPRFNEFRQICWEYDPANAFRNRWTDELLSPAQK